MNRRNIVILTGLGAAALFAGGAFVYSRSSGEAAAPVVAAQGGLVRPHSPVMGPDNATVTIVEFFDPACESCRAFYPYVKQILANYPYQVRLVLRYAAFHKGSDVAIGILEGARKQGKFEVVLEALLARQPEWAMHGAPDLNRAWIIAGEAGLNVEQARKDITVADLTRMLEQDMQDVREFQVSGTPTFFVNGKKPEAFGPEPLLKLVQSELAAAK